MRKINVQGQSHKISDLLLGGKEKLFLDPDDQTKIVSRNVSISRRFVSLRIVDNFADSVGA